MLEARAIRKCVGGTTLLEDLNLSIRPGEVVGVSGGNGSGKTTLIDILVGRTFPDAGEVRVDGRIGVMKGRAARSRVFRTYQVPRLFYQMSIAENVCLGQWAFGPNGTVAGAVSGLPDQMLSAYTLSVGQRRRVVLEWLKARVGHCRYFLLDEPTAGADSEYVASMEHFINTHKKDGVGFLVVEHKPDFLQRISDRMLSLRNGSLIPNELGSQPNFLVDASSSSSRNRQAILRAEGLSVQRGGANVVNNVTLTVAPGETLVVTGRNGCGKSSLLLALYGHPECELDAGKITFDGEDVSSLDHAARIQKGIHILPQEAATFDSLLVEEILQLTADTVACTITNSEMRTLSEIMPHLKTLLRRRCGVLSGGERRMVGIARLLLSKPKLALLDEPLAGLSPESREQISVAISRLAATGAAVVVAEQQDLTRYIKRDQEIVIGADAPEVNPM